MTKSIVEIVGKILYIPAMFMLMGLSIQLGRWVNLSCSDNVFWLILKMLVILTPGCFGLAGGLCGGIALTIPWFSRNKSVNNKEKNKC